MELVRSVAYPSELWALLRFKFGGGKEMVMPTLDFVSSSILYRSACTLCMAPPTDQDGHFLTLSVSVFSPVRFRCLYLQEFGKQLL